MTTGTQNDEIDLLQVLAAIIRLLRRNALVIVIAFVLGTALGLAYYQMSPYTYKSKMIVVVSDVLTESVSKDLFENLNNLSLEKNISSLSQKLNLTSEEASKITSIQVKTTVQKSTDDLGPDKEIRTFLTIEVKASNNTIWPSLQSGLLSFLQNNDYVKVRGDLKRESANVLMKKLNAELNDLQEMKSKIAKGQLMQSGKNDLVFFDPTEVNAKIFDINKEIFELENLLQRINGIHVVEGFSVFEKPASPKLSVSLATGASFGVLFVFVLIAFKGIRKMLRFSEEKIGNT
jgi:hypothetical protein